MGVEKGISIYTAPSTYETLCQAALQIYHLNLKNLFWSPGYKCAFPSSDLFVIIFLFTHCITKLNMIYLNVGAIFNLFCILSIQHSAVHMEGI